MHYKNAFFSSIACVSQDSENALEFSSTKNCPCVCASVHFSGGVACTFASLSLYCSVPPPLLQAQLFVCFLAEISRPLRTEVVLKIQQDRELRYSILTVVKRNLFSADDVFCVKQGKKEEETDGGLVTHLHLEVK